MDDADRELPMDFRDYDAERDDFDRADASALRLRQGGLLFCVLFWVCVGLAIGHWL